MSNSKQWAHINWSPFATNVLDAGEFDLVTKSGENVSIRRNGMAFVVEIGDNRLETYDNTQASYWLNMHEVGGVRKADAK